MSKVKYTYCDSCVFIAYFNAEAGRVEILDQLFDEIEKDNGRKIITSVFSIIEVSHIALEKQRQRLDPSIEQKLDNFWANTDLVEMIDFHENLARKARSLMRSAIQMGHGLKGPDALHLVSAESVKVEEFYTYDGLSKYSSYLGFKICEPYITQPRLFT